MNARSKASFDVQRVLADFNNLDKDVGAWPLAPRVLSQIFIFCFVLVGGWWFFLNDQLDSLAAREQEEVTLKEQFTTKQGEVVHIALYEAQRKSIDESVAALIKQLPNKSDIESLLKNINSAGAGRGLRFDLFKPELEIVKDFYAELPVVIRVTGNYHDFGVFADEVGKLDKIATLNNISITASPQSKEGANLVMDAVVKTFRYLDATELAAKKNADQAAKKGGAK